MVVYCQTKICISAPLFDFKNKILISFKNTANYNGVKFLYLYEYGRLWESKNLFRILSFSNYAYILVETPLYNEETRDIYSKK